MCLTEESSGSEAEEVDNASYRLKRFVQLHCSEVIVEDTNQTFVAAKHFSS